MRTLFLGAPRGRGVVPDGLHAIAAHARRRGLAYLLIGLAAYLLQANFGLGINGSPSLPDRVYLIRKGTAPTVGDLVAFRWHGGGPYRDGTPFVKILAGLPGDRVTAVGRAYFVNGTAVGIAKATSRAGTPLEPGPTGVLPDGRYYVHAPHPDSLDSRYALTGWIRAEQIIGRAHALF